MIGQEKERIKQFYENKIEQYGIKMRIEKSAALNKQRIKKMAVRN